MKHLIQQIRPIYLYALISAFAGGAVITLFMGESDWLTGTVITGLFILTAILGLYYLVRKNSDCKILVWIIAVAFVLRLFIGVALMAALPVYGHPTDQQKAGYVFFDAFRRDTQAQNLAHSEKPILTAFTKKYTTDQYGGYLALSMFVYRYLSPGADRPQLLLILSAWAGAAAVLFFWLAGKRLFGDKTATWGAWLFCLYPQSVLMGASHMREPFLIFFVTASFWAVVEWMRTEHKKPLWLAGICAVGILIISPGILIPLYIFLIGWWLLDRRGKRLPARFYIILAALAVIGISVFAYGIAREGQLDRYSPIQVILNWFKNAMIWDVSQSTNSSGRLEYLFEDFPEFLKTPFVVAYGILQPVLPAAILDKSVWIWNLISSLLAAGWYWVLPLLIYSSFALLKAESALERRQIAWLVVVSWVWIIICSARAGGDQWDNPRYRTIFIPWIALVAAWGWQHASRQKFYWLKHIWLAEAVFLLFFTQWYASRNYLVFGRLPFPRMVVWIVVVWAVILVYGWVTARKQNAIK